MRFSLASTSAVAGLSLVSTALAYNPSFNYGQDKVRGVNLGGWLVLEPWIRPTLFDNTGNDKIIDEYTFGQYQDKDTATKALTEHWDTWITEDDIKQIKAAGLNHIRIPIGHWAFDVSGGEPYIQGQVPYLQKAVGWAKTAGLKVIVDLHGAPGSQNGFDNSGEKLPQPLWHTNQTNIDRTNKVIQQISQMFADQTDTVTVVAPLNEPAGFYGDDIVQAAKNLWLSTYKTIRYPNGWSKGESNYLQLIHDAFQPLSYWKGWEASPMYRGVAMDTHIYQIFGDDVIQYNESTHIQHACANAQNLSTFHLPVVVGEWSPVKTDCAKYVNGRGVGARYDGTIANATTNVGSCDGMSGDGSAFSDDYKVFLRKYWEAQAMSYEKGAGWIQWTWKTEEAADWSYSAGLKGGWIPQNPTDYKYPDVCSEAPASS